MDLTELTKRAALRRDGKPCRNAAGRAGYDPQMLLTLLMYGYACQERSSRQIERLCHTDVAFRLICAGDVPDHTVIARFRQAHAEVFAGLFTQVLRLCRAAGPAKLCTVATDGTKIAANASKQANRSPEWLRAEADRLDAEAAAAAEAARAAGPDGAGPDGHDGTGHEGAEGAGWDADEGLGEVVGEILAEAADTDAAEDALFGSARGDELPAGWDSRDGRRARISQALAKIEADIAAKKAKTDVAGAERAPERAEADAAALAAARAALDTEIATREAAQQTWEHTWEHAMANPGAPLPKGRAPVPVEDSTAVARARERVTKAQDRVDNPDTAPRPGGRRRDPDRTGKRPDAKPQANITDPDSGIMPTKDGWVQGYNVQFGITADQVIWATEVSTNPADVVSFDTMVAKITDTAAQLGDPDGIGTLLFDTGYASNATLAAPGPDKLIALGKTRSVRAAARDNPTTGPPPPDATPREQMDHRLRTPEGAKLYTRRGATAEPGIGNFKKLLDRFSRRGLPAVTSETHLTATVFNLLKIHRAAPT